MAPSEIGPLQDYFSRQPEVFCAFIFGSVAKGIARLDSDLDVAVLMSHSGTLSNFLTLRLRFMEELSAIVAREVDLVVLNEAGSVLTHQILTEGSLVFERDRKETVSFRARAMIEYMDWLPYKKLLDRATLSHFRSGKHG